MAKTQTAHIVITANAKAAVEVMKMLKEQTDIYINRLDALKQKKQQGVQLTKAEEKEAKELEKKIQALTTAQQKNQAEYRKTRDVMKNISGSTTKDLKRAYAELAKMLNSTTGEQTKRQELLRRKMQEVKTQIDKNTGAINSMSKAQSGFGGSLGTTLKNLIAYAGVFQAFGKIKSLIGGVFESNLKLSDSLADIRKVAGLSSEAINQLYRNIAQIDSRNTIETLNSLAYTGAKLGIGQNYGVEGLTGFVKAAEQVQMALGEDMGEDALPALAKMTEVMGLIEKYGVEQSMQKAASAIFQLGATSTATGTNIVEFAKRLYGLANVSRVSADDLLALGSAADAMGLMPEVAATAFNKLFTSVQKNHNMIEKTLGLQPGLIKSYYDQGKTMDAIVAIFDKMNERGNLNLLGNVFKDLGSDGARLVNVMATMSDRVDILKKHLETSRNAFKEGEAVIGEYMIQNQTAQALMERASNLWAKAFTNPEGVDMVKQMAQAWYDLSKSMTQNEGMMYSMRLSIQLIGLAIESLVKLMPILIHLMMFAGVGMAIRGVIVGIQAMVAAIRAATTAQMTFNAAVRSNALLALVSGIATAIAMFVEYSNAAEEAAKRQAEQEAKLKASFDKSKEAVQSIVKPLETYKKVLDEANLSEKQKMELVKDFRNAYQDYLDYLGIEVNTVDDLRDAYARVVEVMKIKKAYEERESFRTEKNGQNRMDRIGNQAQVEAQLRSMGITDIDKEWLEKNQHLGTKGMYDAIMRRRYGSGVVKVEGTGRGRYVIRNSKGKLEEVGSSALYDIIGDYIRSYRAERDTNKGIDEMFDTEFTWTDADGKKRKLSDFDIDDYNRKVQEARWKRKGSLDNEAPDKAAAAAARKAQQDEKQALRKDLQDAKAESDAIIAKVEEWYRLQETVITGMQADGKLTKEQADQAVRTLNIAKNTALRDARLAVSGRDTKAWEVTKQQIGNLMLDQGQWSQELLRQILGVSMESIRKNLSRIDKGGGKYGITTSSLKDAVDKNAAGNQREIARLRARSQQEVEKIFMEYDFFEQAMRGFSDRLAQMGILSETARQIAKRLSDAQNPDALFSMKDYDALLKGNEGAKQQMLQAFIGQGAQPYGVNPEDKEQLRAWFMEFVGQYAQNENAFGGVEYQYQSWAKPFEADFELWLRDSNKYLSSIQAFYFSLMKAEENYYEKRKQSYNFYKKQLDQQGQAAGIPTQREDVERQLQTSATLQDNGIGASFWRQQGLGGILNDPEVMLIQKRIEWRNQDLESAKALLAGKEALWEQEKAQRLANGESEADIDAELAQRRMGFEDLIKERQTALFDQQLALTTKIAQEMRKRVDTVNNLTKPIQEGALNIGKKFGEMLRGVEEQSMTWKEIWHSMAVAVGESVIDMTAQYAQNLIMEKAMNSQSKQEAIDKANVDVAAGTASGSAKTIGQLGWWGIALIPVIAALLKGLLQAAFASNNKSSSQSSSSTPKMKLVSGMLTYDEGNVANEKQHRQNFYVGTDGHVYRAEQKSSLHTGIVRRPIATTVNGEPSLVAEKGTEIVIGRKTTKAMMQDDPELVKAIVDYDKRPLRRPMTTLDGGNVPDISHTGIMVTAQDGPTDSIAEQFNIAITEEQFTSMVNRFHKIQEERRRRNENLSVAQSDSMVSDTMTRFLTDIISRHTNVSESISNTEERTAVVRSLYETLSRYEECMNSSVVSEHRDSSVVNRQELLASERTVAISTVENLLRNAAFSSTNEGIRKNSTKVSSPARTEGRMTGTIGTGGKRYEGSDGHVYEAEPTILPEGISVVTKPIATTISGQPSLVAERGPEIVIGRATTKHIMMNQPELIRILANTGSTHRLQTLDNGNIAEMSETISGRSGTTLPQEDGGREQADRIAAALEQNTATMTAVQQTLASLQKNGIPAHINKWGHGGLIDEVQSGLKFRRKYGE